MLSRKQLRGIPTTTDSFREWILRLMLSLKCFISTRPDALYNLYSRRCPCKYIYLHQQHIRTTHTKGPFTHSKGVRTLMGYGGREARISSNGVQRWSLRQSATVAASPVALSVIATVLCLSQKLLSDQSLVGFCDEVRTSAVETMRRLPPHCSHASRFHRCLYCWHQPFAQLCPP